jgi:hypothetical protein
MSLWICLLASVWGDYQVIRGEIPGGEFGYSLCQMGDEAALNVDFSSDWSALTLSSRLSFSPPREWHWELKARGSDPPAPLITMEENCAWSGLWGGSNFAQHITWLPEGEEEGVTGLLGGLHVLTTEVNLWRWGFAWLPGGEREIAFAAAGRTAVDFATPAEFGLCLPEPRLWPLILLLCLAFSPRSLRRVGVPYVMISTMKFFRGRLNRAEYFRWLVAVIIFCAGGLGLAKSLPLLALVLFAAAILASFSAMIRRLHDLGRSGYYSLIGLVPVLGLVFGVYLALKPGLAD